MNPATAGLKVLSLPFDHETTDVLIGSYLSQTAAHDDYQAALACGAYLHGAILVGRDLTGKVSVEQSDHMVREAAQGLGTLGFLSGLVAWPLIPSPPASVPRWAGSSARRCTCSPRPRSRVRRRR